MYRGFTLFELLIVIGLLGMIASFSAIEGIGSFRTTINRVGFNHSMSLGAFARSRAMHHICEGVVCTEATPHGIHTADEITVFQGISFTDRDVVEDIVFPIQNAADIPADSIYFSNGEYSSF